MRGKTAEEGATRVAPNGYHYTKVDGKWRLTHHIIAERMIGRPKREDERIVFVKSRRDLSPENIRVVEKGRGSLRRRKAQVEARIQELQAELDTINQELLGPVKIDRSK